jgi:septum formation protein
MINNIILASRSGVRKKILDQNGIGCEVIPANIDEELIKDSYLKKKLLQRQFLKILQNLKQTK